MSKLPVVGVLGTAGGVLLSELGARPAMEKVGLNTGNLLFQYSCSKNIKNPLLPFTLTEGLDVGFIRANIDVLCIPAANQLNPEWDLQWWAKLVEDLDKPVVIVGLGAQARIDQASSVVLKPGTVRFLEVIKDRAAYIGVRGVNTLAVLERYGIENGRVTGCPSNFINPSVTGQSIQAKIDLARENGTPVVNLLVGTLEDYSRETERRLFDLFGNNTRRFIRQTDVRVLESILAGEPDESTSGYLKWEGKVVSPGTAPDDYQKRVLTSTKYYFDAKGWIDEVARDDVSIGMRIHGAVAAIQGGSLGVCVAFDARTLELAQTMGYPYVMADDVHKARDIRDVMGSIKFSAEEFDQKRVKLRSEMKHVMERHGIVTSL